MADTCLASLRRMISCVTGQVASPASIESIEAVTAQKDNTTSDPRCRLLELPPELRTQIWEYLVIERDEGKEYEYDEKGEEVEPVAVNLNLKAPPLTQTCRQIRNETIKIWYFRNWFDIDIANCDPSLFAAFLKQARRHGGPDTQMEITQGAVGGNCRWAGLLEWCEMVWKGEIPAFDMPNDDYENVIIGALAIAEACKDGSWQACEKALLRYRSVAGAVDSGWLAIDTRSDAGRTV